MWARLASTAPAGSPGYGFANEAIYRVAKDPKLYGQSFFDITQGRRTERWCLQINKGALNVSTDECEADCVIGAARPLFDGIATGEVNAMAALLRGELAVSGEPELVVLCQRLFPGRPPATTKEGARSS